MKKILTVPVATIAILFFFVLKVYMALILSIGLFLDWVFDDDMCDGMFAEQIEDIKDLPAFWVDLVKGHK